MMNLFFTVSDCTSGFPHQCAIKLVRYRKLGDLEAAVNESIDVFDEEVSRLCTSHLMFVHKAELMELAASIDSIDDVKCLGVSIRNSENKLVQRILSVSIRTGEDLVR